MGKTPKLIVLSIRRERTGNNKSIINSDHPEFSTFYQETLLDYKTKIIRGRNHHQDQTLPALTFSVNLLILNHFGE